MRLVCILEGVSADTPNAKERHTALLEGLQHLGWMPGRNLKIAGAEVTKLQRENMQRNSSRLPRTYLSLVAASLRR